MAGRPKGSIEREMVTTKIDKSLMSEFREECYNKRLKMNEVLEKLIREWLKGENKNGRSGENH